MRLLIYRKHSFSKRLYFSTGKESALTASIAFSSLSRIFSWNWQQIHYRASLADQTLYQSNEPFVIINRSRMEVINQGRRSVFTIHNDSLFSSCFVDEDSRIRAIRRVRCTMLRPTSVYLFSSQFSRNSQALIFYELSRLFYEDFGFERADRMIFNN